MDDQAVEQVVTLVSRGGGDKDFGLDLAKGLSRWQRRTLLSVMAAGSDEQRDAAELTVLLLIAGGDGDLAHSVTDEMRAHAHVESEYRARLMKIARKAEQWNQRR